MESVVNKNLIEKITLGRPKTCSITWKSPGGDHLGHIYNIYILYTHTHTHTQRYVKVCTLFLGPAKK